MKTPWTCEQLKILRDNAGKIKTEDLAKMIGKSKASIQQRACRDGISLKATFERRHKEIIKITGCSYKKALPPEQWSKAQAFLGMMGLLKNVIPNDIKPVLDLEQLQEAFRLRERVVHG